MRLFDCWRMDYAAGGANYHMLVPAIRTGVLRISACYLRRQISVRYTYSYTRNFSLIVFGGYCLVGIRKSHILPAKRIRNITRTVTKITPRPYHVRKCHVLARSGLATKLLDSTSDDGVLKLKLIVCVLSLKLVLRLTVKMILTWRSRSCNFTGMHA